MYKQLHTRKFSGKVLNVGNLATLKMFMYKYIDIAASIYTNMFFYVSDAFMYVDKYVGR